LPNPFSFITEDLRPQESEFEPAENPFEDITEDIPRKFSVESSTNVGEARSTFGRITDTGYAAIDMAMPNLFLKETIEGLPDILPHLKKSLERYGKGVEEMQELQHKELTGQELTPEENERMANFTMAIALGASPANTPLSKLPIKDTFIRLRDYLSNSKLSEAIKKQIIPRYKQFPEYIALDMDRAGSIAVDKLIRKGTIKPIQNLDGPDRVLAGEALKGRTEGVPEHVLGAIKEARKQIDDLTGALVSELDPVRNEALIKTLNDNVGVYIRRVYARDILGASYAPTPEVIQSARSYLGRTLKGKGGRPATKLEIENTIENIIEGRVRGGGVPRVPTSGKKTVNLSPFKKRKDIPKPIRALMGEVEEGSYAAGRTVGDLSNMLHNIRFFKQLNNNPKLVSPTAQVGFSTRPLPNNPIYGSIKNKYVHTSIEDDLLAMGQGDVRNQAEQIYFGWLNAWKEARTIFNPTTHFRNILGNVIFSDLAGINMLNPRNLRYYNLATQSAFKEDLLFRQALRDGAVGTELAEAELKPVLSRLLQGRGGFYGKLNNSMTKTEAFLTKAYNLEDQIPKLASYIKQLQSGASRQQAAAHVNKWFPNYRDVSPIVKRARRNIVGSLAVNPFISFSAEATRIYTNAVKEHPIKLFNWAVTYPAAITAASLYSQGMTLTDLNNVWQSLPDNQKYRFQTLLAWRDKDNSLQTFDISYTFPMGEILQTRGILGIPLIGQFVGTNPLVSFLVDLKAKKKTDIDSPITRPSDMSEFLNTMRFAAESLAPVPSGLSSLIRHLERGGRPGFGGKETSNIEALQRALTPFKGTPLDVQLTARRAELAGEAKEIKTELFRIGFKEFEGRMGEKELDTRVGRLRKKLAILEREIEKVDRARSIVGGLVR